MFKKIFNGYCGSLTRANLVEAKHSTSLDMCPSYDATLAARRQYRRAEQKRRKDKLRVSFQMLIDSWRFYQRTVRAAKTKHFSDIIALNRHKPTILRFN